MVQGFTVVAAHWSVTLKCCAGEDGCDEEMRKLTPGVSKVHTNVLS